MKNKKTNKKVKMWMTPNSDCDYCKGKGEVYSHLESYGFLGMSHRSIYKRCITCKGTGIFECYCISCKQVLHNFEGTTCYNSSCERFGLKTAIVDDGKDA